MTRGRLGARGSRGPGGTITVDATAGNLLLDGRVDAKGGGGRLVATAAGDLVASGRFSAFPGCIALAAGGTVTTGDARLDVPQSATCP